MKNGTRYNVVLSPPVAADLEDLTRTLHVSKTDVLVQSITLLKHAVEADRVELHKKTDTGEEVQEVLLK